jgi:hypothetical protein
MTTYKEISGKQVKNYSSDPANDAEGQVWYNSTSGTFKSLLSVGAWSAGGNLITARNNLAGCGTQTAALGFGGYVGGASALTEEYNGSGWSNGGNLGTARYKLAGAGLQTAALAFGGGVPPSNTSSSLTEEYGGTSWTAGGALGTARKELAGCGTQTAGLAFGGRTTVLTNATEEYGGTSWTAGGNLGSNKYLLAGAGTQTAGLAFGGYFGTSLNSTEEYDGSAWTAGGNLGTARYQLAGAGTQTSALAFGGVSPFTNATESYNGTSWTNSATLATARSILGGAGADNTAALAFGGSSPSITSATEEYNSSFNAITQAVWSSGGNVNTAGDSPGGAGTLSAGLKFGGYPPSGGGVGTTATEEYNGASWTSVNNMNAAGYGLTGTGLQTAAVRFGGYSGTALNNTEEYDGTNWTAVTVVPSPLSSATAFGVQTAAVLAGGYTGTAWLQTALEYDGTNYSSGGTMPPTTGAQYSGSAGTQTAGLVFGGYIPPSALGVTTASYNGSSWSAENNMLISRYTSGSGTQTAALAPGGYQNANPLNPGAGFTLACEQYDGTSWSNTCNNIATRGYQINSNRASNAAGTTGLVWAGGAYPAPGNLNSSEEFTAGTEVITASTLTTS